MLSFRDHLHEYGLLYAMAGAAIGVVALANKYGIEFEFPDPEPKPIFEANIGDKTYKVFES